LHELKLNLNPDFMSEIVTELMVEFRVFFPFLIIQEFKFDLRFQYVEVTTAFFAI